MPSTLINSNATTLIKLAAGYVRQITVAAQGSAWTLQVKDAPNATGGGPVLLGSTPLTVPAVGTVLLPQPLFFSNGITFITSGTTAGELDVDWI